MTARPMTHFATENQASNRLPFARHHKSCWERNHQWDPTHTRSYQHSFLGVWWVLLLKSLRWMHRERSPANVGKGNIESPRGQGNLENLRTWSMTCPKQWVCQRSEQNAPGCQHGWAIHWGLHQSCTHFGMQKLPVPLLRSRWGQTWQTKDQACCTAWLPKICRHLRTCAAKFAYPDIGSRGNQNYRSAVADPMPSKAPSLYRNGGETPEDNGTLAHGGRRVFSLDPPMFHSACRSCKHLPPWRISQWSQGSYHCPLATLRHWVLLPWCNLKPGHHTLSRELQFMHDRPEKIRTRRRGVAYINRTMSGWWLGHPSEKYESQLGWVFPIYGKIKKCSKPPTRCGMHDLNPSLWCYWLSSPILAHWRFKRSGRRLVQFPAKQQASSCSSDGNKCDALILTWVDRTF